MQAALLANVIVFATFAVAATLNAIDADLYYASAQEDELLEWLTFWAFAIAAVVFLRNARDERRERGGLPWFAVGLGLFCALVALEEISWGQRLFAYRPPDYFLERNFQQEFNLHNVVDTELRKAAMHLVLLGYGVVLSGLSLLRSARHWLARLRVVVSPPALMPAFLAISAIYAWYPLRFTGEWVECAMGFAFIAVAALTGPEAVRPRPRKRLLSATLASGVAAVLTVAGLALLLGSDADRSARAEREVALLLADFKGPAVRTRCGIHKRLYTFMRQYNQTGLVRGRFAAQVAADGDAERASFLLDPWNSPYWVRHKCRSGRAVAFVYSFGPNRRRDSSEWEVRADDIGEYFVSDSGSTSSEQR